MSLQQIDLQQFSTFVVCDYRTFLGDALKEKYEGVYVKLIEIKNILKAKSIAAGLSPDKFIINGGEFFADLMECSRTYCFGGHPDRTVEKPYIGSFSIGDVYWEKTLPRNHVVIECNSNKGLLIIENIPIPVQGD